MPEETTSEPKGRSIHILLNALLILNAGRRSVVMPHYLCWRDNGLARADVNCCLAPRRGCGQLGEDPRWRRHILP